MVKEKTPDDTTVYTVIGNGSFPIRSREGERNFPRPWTVSHTAVRTTVLPGEPYTTCLVQAFFCRHHHRLPGEPYVMSIAGVLLRHHHITAYLGRQVVEDDARSHEPEAQPEHFLGNVVGPGEGRRLQRARRCSVE